MHGLIPEYEYALIIPADPTWTQSHKILASFSEIEPSFEKKRALSMTALSYLFPLIVM